MAKKIKDLAVSPLNFEREVYKRFPSPPLRILISGARGFIGCHLVPFLERGGHEVVFLSRGLKAAAPKNLFWDPTSGTLKKEEFEGFDAVIHLAGKNLFSPRWTASFKREVFLSRCRDTWLLSQVLLRLVRPPKVLISVSGAGFYGECKNAPVSEEHPSGKGFLADLCKKWEEATVGAEKRGIRVVHPRLGMVLSPHGGILKKLLPLFRLGLGVSWGSGKQWLSWIALEDLLSIFYRALTSKEIEGAVNVVAPEPVTVEEFCKTLATTLHRPLFLRLNASLLRLLLGEMAEELLLTSTRAIPKKLLDLKHPFICPALTQALTLCNKNS